MVAAVFGVFGFVIDTVFAVAAAIIAWNASKRAIVLIIALIRRL